MKKNIKSVLLCLSVIGLLTACGTKKQEAELTASGLNPADFESTINGKQTALYTLRSNSGMEVCITNFGGRVVSIMVPDRDGNMKDVVLGYDNVAQYADSENSPSDYGASIGRYANRISKHSFQIGDENYELVANDGDNCLHGGPTGWQYQVYEVVDYTGASLTLKMVSPDGDNGFPGEVTAYTTYRLTDDYTLDITWEATSTKETMINQTNHCYFNLNGDPSRVGTNMELYVNADNFTPSDVNYIPTGEIAAVEGTPFDFRTPKVLADVVDDTTFEQIKNATGVDHNFCLNTYKDGKGDDTEVCASLYSPETGIFLEVFTNEPGIQVYTGNFQGVGRDADILRKHGIKYPKHVSVCLESQKYPDTPNHPEWPAANLKPGENYYSHCAYRFSVK